MTSRRDFSRSPGLRAAPSRPARSAVAMAALPEPVIQTSPNTMAPLIPDSGRPYNPVVTLNGWTLPWRMNQGVREFHLVAEPVVRDGSIGMKAHLWGYNGQSPGPTIEVVEGDRVRIFVTNRLPEHAALARPAPAQRHGWRDRSDAASHSVRQDLRLRVRCAPPGHLHVPPARRRDGANGHGHDGLLGHAPEKPNTP